MSKQVHTHRLAMPIVFAAIVIAGALPMLVAFAREDGSGTDATSVDEASELVAAVSASSVAAGTAHRTAYGTGDPAHAASMMIVGTLLIGIGSMVRRAA
jgi:hypothetical protein